MGPGQYWPQGAWLTGFIEETTRFRYNKYKSWVAQGLWAELFPILCLSELFIPWWSGQFGPQGHGQQDLCSGVDIALCYFKLWVSQRIIFQFSY